MFWIWIACSGDKPNDKQPSVVEDTGEVTPERCLGWEELRGTRVSDDAGLAEALAAGTSPIVLEPGTYSGGIEVSGELVGACPEWVTISGGSEGGVLLSGALSGVTVADNAVWGVRVDGGEVRISDVEILRTARGDGNYGYGLDIRGGGVLLTDSRVSGNMNRNVAVKEAVLFASGVEIVDGVGRGNGISGYGLHASGGAHVTLTDSLVDNNLNAGIYVLGSELYLIDTVVSNTVWDDGVFGTGIDAVSGRIEITGGALLNNNAGGIITTSGVELILDGVEVAYNEVTRQQFYGGYGVDALNGSSLTMRDCWLHDNMSTGFIVDGATDVVIEDTVIEDIQPGFNVPVGVGAYFRNSTASMTGVEMRGITGVGMSVYGGEVTVSDVVIEDIAYVALKESGRGIEVATEGTLRMSDSTIQRVHEAAVLCDGEGSTAIFERVDITDVTASEKNDIGMGIHNQSGCAVIATDVAITRPLFVGFGAFLDGSFLDLTDVTVSDVQVTTDGEFGWGGAVTHGAAVVADGLLIEDGVGAGLQIAEGSTADLDNTTIRSIRRAAEQSSAFGLGIQSGGIILADTVTVEDIEGPGITCALADLQCTDCSVAEVAFGGIVMEDCVATIERASVSAVVEDASEGGGVGVFIEEPSYGPCDVTMSDSAVTDTELAAVWIQGPSEVVLTRNTIEAGSSRDIGVEVHGDGVLARDGVLDLVMESNTISGASEAGLLLHGSTATLAGNVWDDNAVDVLQQDCTEEIATISVPSGATASICPEYDEVLLDLHFDAYLTESLP